MLSAVYTETTVGQPWKLGDINFSRKRGVKNSQ